MTFPAGWNGTTELTTEARNCRSIPITLIDLIASIRVGIPTRVVSVIAFHEKAGRSQVGSFWYWLVTLFLLSRVATVATLPSALCDERWFARCKLGVLVSAGAAICLSTSRSILENGSWGQAINAVTGTRLQALAFPFAERFWFYAAAGIAVGLRLRNGS